MQCLVKSTYSLCLRKLLSQSLLLVPTTYNYTNKIHKENELRHRHFLEYFSKFSEQFSPRPRTKCTFFQYKFEKNLTQTGLKEFFIFANLPCKFLENVFKGTVRLRPATLSKKRLWHRCFPVNFPKFVRAPFLQRTSGQLLL